MLIKLIQVSISMVHVSFATRVSVSIQTAVLARQKHYSKHSIETKSSLYELIMKNIY